MSRVVKNLRRCSPRARWKIDAPWMIVLSTSKNAAAGRVGRGRERGLDLPHCRRSLPGEPGALAEVPARARLPRVSWGHHVSLVAAGPGPPVWKTHDVTANLAELLARAAAESPDRVALVDASTGRTLTWGELDDAVSRVAGGLAEQGLVAGNRVVIATANRIEFAVVHLAVLRARLVAVPVNPRSATGELVRMVADSGARLIVADSTTISSARAVVRGLHEALEGADPELRARASDPRLVGLDCAVEAGEVSFDALLAADPAVLPEARDPEALAVLLYTSGTSGRPRAAMLSHRALLANLEQAAAVDPPMLTSDDVVYGVLPLFHVYGLNAVLGQVLHHQACLVVADGFDPEGSLDDIVTHGVTVVPVAPPVLAAWRSVDRLRERLAGVRVLMSGSAPLSSELVAETTTATGLTVHQGYGLTEAAPVVTSTLCSATAKPGSVGSPLPGRRGSGWSTTRAPSRSPGDAGRDPRRGGQPVRRLLARPRRRPGRRVAGHRRRRVPRPRRRPVPGRPPQGAHHRLRLQRLPLRDRGRGARRGRGPRGRRDRRTGRADRRGGRRLRARDSWRRRRACRPGRGRPRPLRPLAWRASSSRPASRWSTPCRSRSPARWRGHGCGPRCAGRDLGLLE